MSSDQEKSDTPKKSIEQVAREVGSYDAQAYYFVFEALDWLMTRLKERRHVKGSELAEAIRDLSVERFGMLAGTVLSSWGLTETADFGRIVYALIETGHMSRTEEDDIRDFDDVYDFRGAFTAYAIPDASETDEEQG